MFDKFSFRIIIELLISFNFSCVCKNLNAYSFKYCRYFKIYQTFENAKLGKDFIRPLPFFKFETIQNHQKFFKA